MSNSTTHYFLMNNRLNELPRTLRFAQWQTAGDGREAPCYEISFERVSQLEEAISVWRKEGLPNERHHFVVPTDIALTEGELSHELVVIRAYLELATARFGVKVSVPARVGLVIVVFDFDLSLNKQYERLQD